MDQIHAATACSANGEEKFLPGPDRIPEEGFRLPVAMISFRASAQARVLSLHPSLLSSNNVLLFSLLLLLTTEETFLSCASDIPTLHIIPLTFLLRLSPMKTPRSSPLLMMSSTSFAPHHPSSS